MACSVPSRQTLEIAGLATLAAGARNASRTVVPGSALGHAEVGAGGCADVAPECCDKGAWGLVADVSGYGRDGFASGEQRDGRLLSHRRAPPRRITFVAHKPPVDPQPRTEE